MKKTLVLIMFVLFAVSFTGCDHDECAVCHECECICKTDNTNIENNNELQSICLCDIKRALTGDYSTFPTLSSINGSE